MASNSQCSVSWESYQRNVCVGFSSFQQNGEFVDMTIAADNHMVKVHKALIALASPYLKKIIQSTPDNQHPIIYLNNVDYNTLCQLLEYIYTGEVMVPTNHLRTFLETGKSLNIRGLENVVDTKLKHEIAISSQEIQNRVLKPVMVKTRSSTEKVLIPVTNKRISSLRIPTSTTATNVSSSCYRYSTPSPMDNDVSFEEDTTFDEAAADADMYNSDYYQEPELSPKPTKRGRNRVDSMVQFTVSTRGSLQMILNRFLYNVQFKSRVSDTRRWRCVDYRDSRCPAYVITKGSVIVKRYHPHNHAFHDKKIITKLESNAVYAAIEEIESEKTAGDDNGDTTIATEDNPIS